MAGRSGGTPIKNLKKVKPGYDQAFTLPKGTSAAPIKQVAKGVKADKKPSILKTMYPEGMKTVKKDALVSAAIATPIVARATDTDVKVIRKIKKIFKKPKSDLGNKGDRKGYPHE